MKRPYLRPILVCSVSIMVLSGCGSTNSPSSGAATRAPLPTSGLRRSTVPSATLEPARPTETPAIGRVDEAGVQYASFIAPPGLFDKKRKRKTPPSGIAGQIVFGGGAGSFCNHDRYEQELEGIGAPRIDVIPKLFEGWTTKMADVELLHTSIDGLSHGLCFAWFAPNQFLDARITTSDGHIIERRVATDSHGFGVWPWIAQLDAPLGTYSIEATLGDRHANATFNVREPDDTRIQAYRSSFGLGEKVDIGFFGFQPNEEIPLYLYGILDRHSYQYEYITDLPPIQADKNGRALLYVPTTAEDQAGVYFVGAGASANKSQFPRYLTKFVLGLGSILNNDTTVVASSTLPPETTANGIQVGYDATNTLDYTYSTVWAEGVPGPGIGESLMYTFNQPFVVTAIELRNGYGFTENQMLYAANNRVKRLKLVLSDGQELVLDAGDTKEMQTLTIGNLATSSLQLVIEAVYQGSQYDDTVLSDVIIYGYPGQ